MNWRTDVENAPRGEAVLISEDGTDWNKGWHFNGRWLMASRTWWSDPPMYWQHVTLPVREREKTMSIDVEAEIVRADICASWTERASRLEDLARRLSARVEELEEGIKHICDVEERNVGSLAMAERIIDIAANGRTGGVMSDKCEEAAQAVLGLRARVKDLELNNLAFAEGAEEWKFEATEAKRKLAEARATIAKMLEEAQVACASYPANEQAEAVYDTIKAIAEDDSLVAHPDFRPTHSASWVLP